MEANFFRILCAELAPELVGSRIEKIWSPAPGVWTLGFGGGGGKRFLMCRCRPAPGLLFLSSSRPENPLAPPARAMWLRKRLLGRRAVGLIADWPRLRLALALTERNGPDGKPAGGRFLLIDLRGEAGREILPLDDLPEGFGLEPEWPAPADLPRLLPASTSPIPSASSVLAPSASEPAPAPAASRPASAESDLWRRHPQLSPPARRTLTALLASVRPDEAAVLLQTLREGRAETFHLYADEAGPRDPLPFPLPASLARGLDHRLFSSALEAARAQGETLLFAGLARVESAQERAEETARRKRVRKALMRLEEDERRSRAMVALTRQAEALQANLHLLNDGPAPVRITLEHPTHGPVTVELDPRLSPSANMERLFAQAAKGKRGLAFAAARRDLLLADLASGPDSVSSPPSSGPGQPSLPLGGQGFKERSTSASEWRSAPSPASGEGEEPSPWPPEATARQRALRQTSAPTSAFRPSGSPPPVPVGAPPPKLFRSTEVKLFRSSDGFWLARGRNQGANHRLLTKAASPFDYWLHAEGGPGAHVIVKRDHPGQVVPRQTLLEAAALAGLASWRSRDDRADVLLALVKDVRPMKGAAMGEVRVEAVLETLRPDLDPGLESRLGVAAEPLDRSPAGKRGGPRRR